MAHPALPAPTTLAGADAQALRMLAHRPATEKMINYARFLINDRQTSRLNPAAWRSIVMALLDSETDPLTLEHRDVGDLIDVLKPLQSKQAAQRQSPQPKAYPDVAEGRYALEGLDGYKNEVAFFKIDRPTQGRWAGRTFVSQYKSDEKMPVRGEGARRILELIAADPRAAMILFGKETSRCGHCGRRLTDDESRARGIGPVCAEKMGW